MGINKFVFFLLFVSITFLMIDKQQKIVVVNQQEVPTVSFYDSVMYEITENNLNQIVHSKEAYIYDKREELVESVIIARTKKDTSNTNTNIVSSDNIVKIKNDLYMDGNVNLQLNNNLTVKTEQIQYNLKTSIAKNNIAFEIIQNGNKFTGEELFLDAKSSHIIAKNTKFQIKVFDE